MFTAKQTRCGQARAYQDSVYSWDIESDLPKDEVIAKALAELGRGVNPANISTRHSGACGFPFGLSSFYSFSQVSGEKYTFTVTEPYCD